MTSLPSAPTARRLGLVIDLDVCVGCHACVVACKEWNTGGYGAALSDQQPYGADVSGAWLNRVHTYEVTPEARDGIVIGEAGDALITIKVRPHPAFRVEGSDIHADLPVPLKDAVLGVKAPVQTLTGRVAVTVPAWSSSDKVLRIKGKGLARKGGGHGDLLVHVRIMLPEGGDPALEAFLRESVAKQA